MLLQASEVVELHSTLVTGALLISMYTVHVCLEIVELFVADCALFLFLDLRMFGSAMRQEDSAGGKGQTTDSASEIIGKKFSLV